MKKLMLSTALIFATGFAAQAQDQFRATADAMQIPASELVGKRVYASEAAVDADEYAGMQDGWEDIGEINEIMLNRDGTVDSVLVDIGGFLGMGERQVAVGMNSLRFVADSATPEDLGDYFLVLNANRAVIEGAPAYERTMAPATGTVPADGTVPAEGTTVAPANDTAVAPAAGTAPMADADGMVAVDSATLVSDDIIGASVYGPNNESIGKVSELKLSADNQAEQIMVDVGGFLGIGSKTVALPISDVEMMRKGDNGAVTMHITMTEDQLKALPEATK